MATLMAGVIAEVLRYCGRWTLDVIQGLGQVVLLAKETAIALVVGRFRWRLFLYQILEIGTRSQLVVVVTGAFTGAVFAAQTYYQFAKVSMESGVGVIVAVAMCRELGPVLCGLMVAGRVGAAMSAEIGTMKVTEQIDALRSLGVHPVDYLVVPRVTAMIVSMPLLVGLGIAMGIGAGYYVGVELLGINGTYFVVNMLKFTGWADVLMGLIKALVFGLVIVFVACHQGLAAREGAVGVGHATTQAVVISSLAILISNFFLTVLLNVFLSVS